ncbi:hypothetical protein [Roseibium sp. MMSF_3412]|uniref:hypothetical protein n=1 Tax=Roseibium sp. MMSF_3412 TaxID=3046712 RepID=UPI00273ECFBC|nr:hypothetical protein [Roseibium sp. MMSF_3412]
MTMPVLKRLFVSAAAAVFLMQVAPVSAQSVLSADTKEAVTEGDPNRFSLVEADDEILRVDRQNGTISICQEQNGSWRCNPVPLAEEAYLAEINELAAEVDRLTARLEELSPDGGASTTPELSQRPRKPDSSDGSGWTEDDEELERMLTFTESAMRRFFGMVRDLQKDFEGEGN